MPVTSFRGLKIRKIIASLVEFLCFMCTHFYEYKLWPENEFAKFLKVPEFENFLIFYSPFPAPDRSCLSRTRRLQTRKLFKRLVPSSYLIIKWLSTESCLLEFVAQIRWTSFARSQARTVNVVWVVTSTLARRPPECKSLWCGTVVLQGVFYEKPSPVVHLLAWWVRAPRKWLRLMHGGWWKWASWSN